MVKNTHLSLHLYIAPGCHHCAAMLQLLTPMIKQGDIATLQITNLASLKDHGKELGIRSVPVLLIGEYRFDGAMTEKEIRFWMDRANTYQGSVDYLRHLLKQGQLAPAIQYVKTSTDSLKPIFQLAADTEEELNTRIGVSAVIEELAGTTLLSNAVNGLAELATHHAAAVRADAAHYLSLTGNPRALPVLESLAGDKDENVREIAKEGLESLKGN